MTDDVSHVLPESSHFGFEDLVEDRITGFTGKVVGYTAYMNGCVQFLLAGTSKDGGKPVQMWIDDIQLVLKEKAQAAQLEHVRAGGPSSETRRAE